MNRFHLDPCILSVNQRLYGIYSGRTACNGTAAHSFGDGSVEIELPSTAALDEVFGNIPLGEWVAVTYLGHTDGENRYAVDSGRGGLH